jgi:hypothetical protein
MATSNLGTKIKITDLDFEPNVCYGCVFGKHLDFEPNVCYGCVFGKHHCVAFLVHSRDKELCN